MKKTYWMRFLAAAKLLKMDDHFKVEMIPTESWDNASHIDEYLFRNQGEYVGGIAAGIMAFMAYQDGSAGK